MRCVGIPIDDFKAASDRVHLFSHSTEQLLSMDQDQVIKKVFYSFICFINLFYLFAVYVICRRGEDSQIAVLYLRKEFADSLISFKDIDGGYEKWSHAVDKDFPIYQNRHFVVNLY